MLDKINIFLIQFGQKITLGDQNDQVSGINQISGDQLMANILNGVYYIAGFVSVIVLIIGGIMYTTSSGNASSVTKAKGLITYSIVGLVVVFLAFAITNFITGSF